MHMVLGSGIPDSKETVTSSVQPANHSVSRYYRQELDVVRFLAFLLVFLYHTLPPGSDPRIIRVLKGFTPALDSFTEACGYGLSLFFTLSAFLICELLLRERASTETVRVKQFYIRRILRIWPLYYFALALGLIFLFLPGSVPGDVKKIGWFAIFMGSWFGVTQGLHFSPLTPLWSISVEEQFYLFAPWVVKFLTRKLLYGFCAALLITANLWLYYLGRDSANDGRIWFNSFIQFECFAGGILLCLFLRSRIPSLLVWQRITLLAFSFILWFYTCYGLHARFGNPGDTNPGSWRLICGYALVTLGCVLMLVAFLGVDARLLPRWAIYLGRISFGLYVYHAFVIYLTYHLILQNLSAYPNPLIKSLKVPIFLLNLCLTLGMTVLLAALSYRYLETPFLKMKKRHSVIESQPIQTPD